LRGWQRDCNVTVGVDGIRCQQWRGENTTLRHLLATVDSCRQRSWTLLEELNNTTQLPHEILGQNSKLKHSKMCTKVANQLPFELNEVKITSCVG